MTIPAPQSQSGDNAAGPPEALPQPVVHFFELTEELGSLLEHETDLLEQRRYKDAAELSEEKARLTSDYQATLATLRAQDDALLGPKTSETRKRLKAESERFRNRLARHARLVVRLKSMNEGLIKSISEEARRQRDPVNRYGGNGQLGARPTEPTSLSLDRSI